MLFSCLQILITRHAVIGTPLVTRTPLFSAKDDPFASRAFRMRHSPSALTLTQRDAYRQMDRLLKEEGVIIIRDTEDDSVNLRDVGRLLRTHYLGLSEATKREIFPLGDSEREREKGYIRLSNKRLLHLRRGNLPDTGTERVFKWLTNVAQAVLDQILGLDHDMVEGLDILPNSAFDETGMRVNGEDAEKLMTVFDYDQQNPDDELLCPEHVDKGLLTLVALGSPNSDQGGLEVQLRDGSWVRIPENSSERRVVVMVGHALQTGSGGKYRAVPHRVRAGSERRLSFAFKLRPNIREVLSNNEEKLAVQKFYRNVMTDFELTHESVNREENHQQLLPSHGAGDIGLFTLKNTSPMLSLLSRKRAENSDEYPCWVRFLGGAGMSRETSVFWGALPRGHSPFSAPLLTKKATTSSPGLLRSLYATLTFENCQCKSRAPRTPAAISSPALLLMAPAQNTPAPGALPEVWIFAQLPALELARITQTCRAGRAVGDAIGGNAGAFSEDCGQHWVGLCEQRGIPWERKKEKQRWLSLLAFWEQRARTLKLDDAEDSDELLEKNFFFLHHPWPSRYPFGQKTVFSNVRREGKASEDEVRQATRDLRYLSDGDRKGNVLLEGNKWDKVPDFFHRALQMDGEVKVRIYAPAAPMHCGEWRRATASDLRSREQRNPPMTKEDATCQICFEEFEFEGRPAAKLLPCAHRLCRGCAEKLHVDLDGNLKCPFCKQNVNDTSTLTFEELEIEAGVSGGYFFCFDVGPEATRVRLSGLQRSDGLPVLWGEVFEQCEKQIEGSKRFGGDMLTLNFVLRGD